MGGWGSTILNLLVKIQIQCLYGIFDHSEHIIFCHEIFENIWSAKSEGWGDRVHAFLYPSFAATIEKVTYYFLYRGVLKGIVHQFFVYCIFWIVMGRGKADFGRKGL